MRCQAKQHLPTVHCPSLACDHGAALEFVYERNGGVVLHAQPFSDCPNRGEDPLREPAQREEQLMLLRFDPGVPRRLLAESEELSHLVAEGRQLSVALGR